MAKKTLVNSQNDNSVEDLLSKVEIEQRKKDSFTILEVLNSITGEEPKLWGAKIVGYGKYAYQRKNGDQFEWFNVGFSPTKAHLSIYLMLNMEEESLMDQLGPHKKGRGCLYIKKLEDVNMDVLKQLLKKAYEMERR